MSRDKEVFVIKEIIKYGKGFVKERNTPNVKMMIYVYSGCHGIKAGENWVLPAIGPVNDDGDGDDDDNAEDDAEDDDQFTLSPVPCTLDELGERSNWKGMKFKSALHASDFLCETVESAEDIYALINEKELPPVTYEIRVRNLENWTSDELMLDLNEGRKNIKKIRRKPSLRILLFRA